MPHCNAYAVAAGDGVVLLDCGLHEPGSLAQLERAMAQVGLALGDVRLLVCTHAHSDHYGQAASVVDVSGCELWMHPAHEHMRAGLDNPNPRTSACTSRSRPTTSCRCCTGEELTQLTAGWWLPETLCYLRHLAVTGVVVAAEEGETERWALA